MNGALNITDDIIITGDLNFHIDDLSNPDGRRFLDSIHDRGMIQHVEGATHALGHTQDVVITRENSKLISGKPSVSETPIGNSKDDCSKLDHFAIVCTLNVDKPPKQRKTLAFRKFNEIINESFQADVDGSCISLQVNASVEDLVNE